MLDVFAPEPLPNDSPLWSMSNVLITPHVAADSDPITIASRILRDVEALERGEPLPAQVDSARGY